MRLVKDARLSLPLTEVMKIARLTSPLLDAPHLSSPRPRLRHGRRLALLSRPNLTLNPYTLFFALSLYRFASSHSASSSLVSAAPTSLPFLFSSSLTLAVSSAPSSLLRLSFYFKLSGKSGRNCLLFPSVPSGYNGSPNICLSRASTHLMGIEGRGALLQPSAIPCTLFSYLLYPLLSFLGLEAYYLICDTQVPRFSLRNLCSLVMLAVFSLVFVATDTAFS